MTTATPTKRPWLLQHRCVGCGLRAEMDRSDSMAAARCPRCDLDWAERPPRSYAELEGFQIPSVEPECEPAPKPGPRDARSSQLMRALEVGLFLLLILGVLAVASANVVAALRGG